MKLNIHNSPLHYLTHRQKKIFFLLLLPVLIVWAIPLPSPLFPDDYSTVVLAKDNRILRVFLNSDEQWLLPPREELAIPAKLSTAVLTYEDAYFHYHPGVNPISLGRALYQNVRSGKVISGASTITMQVARLMSPKSRTLSNKTLEMLQALKIELYNSKSDILRLYLDHAPYGGNIIGYQAAALRYFLKFPEQLTWAEAALLAVLPNAPGLMSPDKNSRLLKNKRDRLLGKLLSEGHISRQTYELAIIEPLPDRSQPFKMLAPHLTRLLKHRAGHQHGIISTTIDRDLQENIAGLVHHQLSYLKEMGIRNGAALVADTKSGEIVAYVGSQDFFDVAASGQVDGVSAARSSGSILKPFLYALCIDEGIILPQTTIRDVPSYYGAFAPSNAAETFDGITSAEDALVRSLNIPAVRLLYTYGQRPFYHFLEAAGISSLFRPAEEYGLPLILGGAEVSPLEVAGLYRGLGNGGRFTPLRMLRNTAADSGDTHDAGQQLISPMAGYLTLNMLKKLQRPGAEYYWNQYSNQWPLAWKTGTSYGSRDAWAVGVSPQWTIAVWVGNFDGEGNANLSGARSAGPLLFDIFNYLPRDPENAWFKKPADAAIKEICRESGFRAGGNCPVTRIAESPPHMRTLRICPYHRRVFLSAGGDKQVCSLCWTAGEYKSESRLVYPADISEYLRQRGQSVPDLPLHSPECPSSEELQAPLQIVYPQHNSHIIIPRDFDGTFQKVNLQLAHRDNSRKVFWYIDDHYLGQTQHHHQQGAHLERGWHTLEVVDESGYRDRNRFFVGIR